MWLKRMPQKADRSSLRSLLFFPLFFPKAVSSRTNTMCSKPHSKAHGQATCLAQKADTTRALSKWNFTSRFCYCNSNLTVPIGNFRPVPMRMFAPHNKETVTDTSSLKSRLCGKRASTALKLSLQRWGTTVSSLSPLCSACAGCFP